jgi:hypothetical protein
MELAELTAAMADPVVWSERVLHHRLWSAQKKIFRAIATEGHSRVMVRSGNGLGKSFCAADLVLWWLARYPDGIALVTAPTQRQATAQIFLELRKTLAQSGDDAVEFDYGPPNQSSISLAPGNYCSAFSTSDTDQGVRLSGFHGRLLLVVDEGSGVPQNIWSAIAGVRSAGNVSILVLFNPLSTSGGVYEAARSGQYHEIVLNCFDSPNFRNFPIEKLRSLPAGLNENDPVFRCDGEWGETLAKPSWAYSVL